MTTDDQSNIIRASTSSYAMGSDDAELEANWRLICAARNDGDDNNENDGGSSSSNSEIIWREWFFSKMEKIVDMNSTTATTSTTTTDSTNNNNLTAAAANNNNNPTLKNVTVVFGQAGSGKTFLMQLLCSSARFEGRILLPFFCKAAAAAAGTPTDFLGDLEAAIGATFPALRQQIASNVSASAKVANFNVHFREHTLRLLAAMGREESAAVVARHQLNSRRYLLLIDSIDLRPDICELISSNLHAFPPWLHVVITARQKRYRGITKMFSGARKIVLDDTKKGNVYGDLMGYLVANKDRMVAGEKAAAEKAGDQSAPTSISNAVFSKMIAKSNGAVLYLRLLRDGLQRGVLSLSQLDFIGGTLNGLYLALFTALFNGGGEGSAEREADYKTVLSLLHRGNAFQVTVDEVRRKLGLSEETEGGDDAYLAELLDQLLLHGLVVFTSSSEQAAATAIRLVHGSLFEWLSDVKHCSARFVCHAQVLPAEVLLPAGAGSSKQQPQQPSRNLISTKYINDNADDSLNEISDDMLYEREAVAQGGGAGSFEQAPNAAASYLLNSSTLDDFERAPPPPQGKHQRDVFLPSHQQPPPKQQHFGHGKIADASLLRNVNNTINNNSFNHNGRLMNTTTTADDDCLVDSEDDCAAGGGQLLMTLDHLPGTGAAADQAVADGVLSKTEISKEYLSKLYSKFESALHLSDLKTLGSILSRYGNLLVNAAFLEGKTPLYWAIKKSNLRLVELLLEAGAAVNAICDQQWGYTPLLVALMQHSVDLVELLLEADADVEQLDRYSMPPLLHALLVNCSPEIVRLLLYWGAGTDFIDEAGRSLLHFAANEPKTWPETVTLLLTVGCDELARDNTGQTALHMAAANGSAEVVELLVEFGGEALLTTADKAGLLPLHVALGKSAEGSNSTSPSTSTLDVGVIEPLISARTINVVAHSGDSPLRLAVLGGHLELAQLLLLRGAEVNYRDGDGRSIVYCVVAFAHSTLEQKGGPPFFNLPALTYGGPEAYLEAAVKTVHFLVRYGADLEAKDMEGRTR